MPADILTAPVLRPLARPVSSSARHLPPIALLHVYTLQEKPANTPNDTAWLKACKENICRYFHLAGRTSEHLRPLRLAHPQRCILNVDHTIYNRAMTISPFRTAEHAGRRGITLIAGKSGPIAPSTALEIGDYFYMFLLCGPAGRLIMIGVPISSGLERAKSREMVRLLAVCPLVPARPLFGRAHCAAAVSKNPSHSRLSLLFFGAGTHLRSAALPGRKGCKR